MINDKGIYFMFTYHLKTQQLITAGSCAGGSDEWLWREVSEEYETQKVQKIPTMQTCSVCFMF